MKPKPFSYKWRYLRLPVLITKLNRWVGPVFAVIAVGMLQLTHQAFVVVVPTIAAVIFLWSRICRFARLANHAPADVTTLYAEAYQLARQWRQTSTEPVQIGSDILEVQRCRVGLKRRLVFAVKCTDLHNYVLLHNDRPSTTEFTVYMIYPYVGVAKKRAQQKKELVDGRYKVTVLPSGLPSRPTKSQRYAYGKALAVDTAVELDELVVLLNAALAAARASVSS